MELHFSKSVCQCLRKAACQVVSQEQTQELRLPDTLPDIGRVLGSWGQIVIRSKEWRASGMNVSGGVMVWVLYAPEDGSQPQTLDCWIPIQLKWDFPQTQRDGTICILPLLKSVDARSVSARKLMVRAAVSVLGEALEPTEEAVYAPPQVPEDIQLLNMTYPMELPQEAGEKLFQMEEELIFPASVPAVVKVLRYELMPGITEQKVLAGRLVFRGDAVLRMLYMTDAGEVCSWSWELPFSQYTELDRDYGVNAAAWIIPIVTALELERGEDGKWLLKAGIAAQYVIHDRVMLELTQDAYSPNRQLDAKMQTLQLPMRLDTCQEQLQIRQEWEMQGQKILDTVWYHDHPRQSQEGDMLALEIPGQFQVLYMDEEGQLQGGTVRTEDRVTLRNDPDNRVDAYIHCTGGAAGSFASGNGMLSADAEVNCTVTGVQGLTMMTELEAGEMMQPDPKRPSLILRRAGGDDLWNIAKSCGSTVDAIRKANALEEDPAPSRMLLIPIS